MPFQEKELGFDREWVAILAKDEQILQMKKQNRFPDTQVLENDSQWSQS